jgi:hypothetical protein
MSKENVEAPLTILKFTFAATLPTADQLYTPNVDNKFFYVFLITRLSKCFVSVASKMYLLKEQAYRKALMVVKAQEMKKLDVQVLGYQAKAFVQVNKKSMLYKRAMFSQGFDKWLREEELKVFRDPKKMAM